jgi:HEAT repeat protein
LFVNSDLNFIWKSTAFALRAIGERAAQHEQVIPALLGCLVANQHLNSFDATNQNIRVESTGIALYGMGEALARHNGAIALLEGLQSSAVDELRCVAVAVLASIANSGSHQEPVVGVVTKALAEDSSEEVREYAACSFLALGPKAGMHREIVSALVTCLETDEVPRVRECAAMALREFTSVAALHADIVPALLRCLTTDTPPRVRHEAAVALRSLFAHGYRVMEQDGSVILSTAVLASLDSPAVRATTPSVHEPGAPQ